MRAIIRAALAVATLVTLMALPAAPAAAAPATTTPVGTWSGVVSWDGGQSDVVLVIKPGGQLCVPPGTEPTGGLTSEGKGTWRPAGPNAFGFQAVERFSSGGQTVGFMHTKQAARQRGESFTSLGRARHTDAAGTTLYELDSRITLQRTSTTPQGC